MGPGLDAPPLDDPGTAIGPFIGQGGKRTRGLLLPHPSTNPHERPLSHCFQNIQKSG